MSGRAWEPGGRETRPGGGGSASTGELGAHVVSSPPAPQPPCKPGAAGGEPPPPHALCPGTGGRATEVLLSTVMQGGWGCGEFCPARPCSQGDPRRQGRGSGPARPSPPRHSNLGRSRCRACPAWAPQRSAPGAQSRPRPRTKGEVARSGPSEAGGQRGLFPPGCGHKGKLQSDPNPAGHRPPPCGAPGTCRTDPEAHTFVGTAAQGLAASSVLIPIPPARCPAENPRGCRDTEASGHLLFTHSAHQAGGLQCRGGKPTSTLLGPVLEVCKLTD